MSVNRYGLDDKYFRDKLIKLAENTHRFTPYEMYLALTRLADVVQESTLPNEPARGEAAKVNV